MNAFDVKIRPLEPSDKVPLWQFTTQCGERTQELFRPVPWFYGFDGVEWFMGNTDLEGARRFVAVNGIEEIVGLVYYVPQGERAAFGICVADKWQRQGIGNRMMETIEIDAKRHGFKYMVTIGGTHKEGMLRGLLRKRGYLNRGFCVGSRTNILKEKKLENSQKICPIEDDRRKYSALWEDIWSNPSPWGNPPIHRLWYAYLLSLLCDRRYDNILDAGCGDGYFTNMLSRYSGETVGLDISKRVVKRAEEQYGSKVTFLCGDLRDVESFGQFALISCIDSLYYLPKEDLGSTFLKLWDKVSPNGRMVVTLYNMDASSSTGTLYRDALCVYGELFQNYNAKKNVSERFEKIIYILEKK